MGGVEGMMQKMKLSEAERKGIKIGVVTAARKKKQDLQAIRKVFSDMLAREKALEMALGKVWCPIKGLECKENDENVFLFTFFKALGKKRALEEGPWMLSKEVIMVDFDGSKLVDEINFLYTPLWVRVIKMPLGMMNRAYGEAIGDQVGTFMDMETEDDGSAVGHCIRIKVRFDIHKPLMCDVTLIAGGREGKSCVVSHGI